MLGYMNEAEAKAAGFEFHGSYYGIPVWMTIEPETVVAAKWAPMEYLMTAMHHIEQFINFVTGREASFCFAIVREIQ